MSYGPSCYPIRIYIIVSRTFFLRNNYLLKYDVIVLAECNLERFPNECRDLLRTKVDTWVFFEQMLFW